MIVQMHQIFIVGLLCTLVGTSSAKEHMHADDFSDGTIQYIYESPIVSGFAYIAEHFDDHEKFNRTWILSQAKKDNIDEEIAKYDGIWNLEETVKNPQAGDYGLVLKSKARHAAIAAPLAKPFHFKDKPLIVQYEVNLQEGQECGGAYLKLLTLDPAHKDLKLFHDKTPYTIMFGPDKCGNDHKLHFIFRHINPLNGSIEEKHCKKPKDRLEDAFKEKQSHLYTLIVRPDNTFEVKLDNVVINDGSLLDDFTPPVNPPLEIEDPDDKRPEDWDEREKIPDPLAIKPEDWDENAPAQIVDEEAVMPDGWLENESPMIPDPSAIKPDDWDTEMDGDWEPPMLTNSLCEKAPGCGPWKQPLKPNPRYKGKWLPPLINNPSYKGKWMPRLIHNPNYFNDEHPFRMSSIFAVGFELWSMSPNILFDNLIITDNEEVARKWAKDTFDVRQARIAQENWSSWNQLVEFTVNNPWIWAIYVIIAGFPIIMLIYCCCFQSQDNQDSKSEDQQLLELDKKAAEASEEKADQESKEIIESEESEDREHKDESEDREHKDETEEDVCVDDKEDKNVDEEKVHSENPRENSEDGPMTGGEGPRRRKPNKE